MATVVTRRDIWSLQPGEAWHPTVHAYAQAVRVMQHRDPRDPDSWAFQAALHARFGQPPHGRWDGCQHQSWFFLPWHRMYLWFFERIVRAAVPGGAPAEFALPYWNYEKPTPANTLPLPFRRSIPLTDGNPNPLVLDPPLRSPEAMRGEALRHRAGRITSDAAMRSADFAARGAAGAVAFGGEIRGRAHFGQVNGAVEGNPHNLVHSALGGTARGHGPCAGALMNDPRCAALDPIFWLHHANIDRLWERWRSGGQTHSDPDDSAWLGQRFTFYDERKQEVEIRVADVLDTTGRLGYRYDNAESGGSSLEGTTPVEEPNRESRPRSSELPPEVVAGTDRSVEVTDRPVTVPVVVPERLTSRLESLSDEPQRVLLSVEGIQADPSPGVGYAVHLNLPDDADPATDDRYAVGSFSLFGVEQMTEVNAGQAGLREVFDVTDLIARLAHEGRWNPQAITVTVEPFDPFEPGGEAGLESTGGERQVLTPDLPTVRIGQVNLLVG